MTVEDEDELYTNCLGMLANNESSEGVNLSEIPNELLQQMEWYVLPFEVKDVPGLNPDEKTAELNQPTQQALARQEVLLDKIWPQVANTAKCDFPAFAETFQVIRATKAPNFSKAQIPVVSDLNIQQWENRLQGYHDQMLCKFLKYGWPIGYHLQEPPVTVKDNHTSALQNMDHVRKFIQKELECKAILGPFKS